MSKCRLLVLAVALLAVVGAVACGESETTEQKETIVFSDLNWTSAQVQNRIAQYLVEKGYGYPTDVVFGATLSPVPGSTPGATAT